MKNQCYPLYSSEAPDNPGCTPIEVKSNSPRHSVNDPPDTVESSTPNSPKQGRPLPKCDPTALLHHCIDDAIREFKTPLSKHLRRSAHDQSFAANSLDVEVVLSRINDELNNLSTQAEDSHVDKSHTTINDHSKELFPKQPHNMIDSTLINSCSDMTEGLDTDFSEFVHNAIQKIENDQRDPSKMAKTVDVSDVITRNLGSDPAATYKSTPFTSPRKHTSGVSSEEYKNLSADD